MVVVVVSAPTIRGVVVVFLLALVVEVDEVVISSLTMVLKVDVMVAPSALVVLEMTRVSPSWTSRVVVNRCAKTEVTRKRVARTAEGVNRILVESKGDVGVTCIAE